jgi:alkylation response protein AidB-like acyl-CoA dehydrogenase
MSLTVDIRDQKFVLYEMLDLESFFSSDKYSEHSKEIYDMTLELAEKIGQEEALPLLSVGDSEGAQFKDGNVTIPEGFKHLHKIMNDSGLFGMHVSPDNGGLGFPYVMDMASREHSVFNMGFTLYPEASIGAANLIASFGSEAQKSTYMTPMYEGKWGGTMVLTEPDAGSDVGALKTKAILQPDGSYRIKGSKIFISGGDNDLFDNIVHPVLARIEGAPEGTSGISIFLVPKYLVNADGSLGERNDLCVTGIEHKMGLKGSATCSMSFGDSGDCYGELLGAPGIGMRIMFQMMNGARIGMGLQGTGTASVAYLHALSYARERVQGADIANMSDPSAKKVPIINHPDVRRMLLSMKSQVEGMRALVYFCAWADDKTSITDDDESKKWKGIVDLLVPVVKSYCTDLGFKVTEQAIQIYGGAGYTKEFPVEQLMRDLKIGSIYEGTNGIQSLDLVGRKLGMDQGQPFKNLLAMMAESVSKAGAHETLQELAGTVGKAAQALGGAGAYFATCFQSGKQHIPVVQAYPFLNLFGNVALGWLHLWQADLATQKLQDIMKSEGVNADDKKGMYGLVEKNPDAAFYLGKIKGATYYIKNILPEAFSLSKTIQNGDLSILEIPDQSFGA